MHKELERCHHRGLSFTCSSSSAARLVVLLVSLTAWCAGAREASATFAAFVTPPGGTPIPSRNNGHFKTRTPHYKETGTVVASAGAGSTGLATNDTAFSRSGREGKRRGVRVSRRRGGISWYRGVVSSGTYAPPGRGGGGAAAVSMDAAADPKLIDGKATAAEIRAELKAKVDAFSQEFGGVKPGLAVVLVGDRRDSATYVRMKKKACAEIGISSFGFDFPEDVAQDALLACVSDLNARPDVNGILVQLPLPKHIDEQEVLQAITPSKDVDGLHPENVAALCTGRTRAGKATSWDLADIEFHVPCTPQGVVELLDRHGVQIAGKRAVVIGRSNIVGIPVSMLLMHRDATVTMTHSKTVDVASVVKNADIVVSAAGRAEMVKGDWIKPGAAVIDVGINSIDDSTKKSGYRLVGDVEFAAAKENASKITPVPGGVGPMTIAMLLRNTVNGAIRARAASGTADQPPAPPSTEEAAAVAART